MTGPTAPAALELTDVSKDYGAVRALHRVSLRIDRGEFVAFIGSSGSGKSTLLHAMGTLSTPSTGHVTLAGQRCDRLDDDALSALRARRLGFVFQQSHLAANLTATENVATGLLYAGVPRAQRPLLAREALERVGLSHRLTHRPNELSGGERQRVGIARAIVNRPELVLADEPTGALDSANSAAILDLLQRLHDEGTTIALITHDPSIAARAPRRITLRDGHVIDDSRNT